MNSKVAGMILAVLVLAGCSAKPSPVEGARASEKAGVLFEIDGVRVYRFYDAGHYHYFAVPRGGVSAASFSAWNEVRSCGKNCTYTVELRDEVPTIGVQ